jgi:hypothetical protein
MEILTTKFLVMLGTLLGALLLLDVSLPLAFLLGLVGGALLVWLMLGGGG